MRAALLIVLLLVSGLSFAETPETEIRIRNLEEKLRCLVCQNQTLADSSATLAADLRKQVRDQIAAGKSDAQVIEYLVQRYGDFVLYDPPFKTTTLLLWLGPFVLLAAAGAVLVTTLRRRRRAPDEPALGQDDQRLVERVLGPQPQPGDKDGGAG